MALVLLFAVLSGAAAQNPKGIDVSHWQGTINWNSVKSAGYTFAFIKATEGTSYTSDTFSAQYTGAYNAGIIRGAYHFATPDTSSGATQATFFCHPWRGVVR